MSTDFLLALSLALSAPFGMILPPELLANPTPAVAGPGQEGPAALERLLAQHDALPEGRQKAELEARIDAVAGQKYASVSRLYWHTDLDRARDAARQSGRPILSLRMLGRLDEELSCANSRLFRVVLYANEDLSRFLRENFVLHWSSERPVPKVTFDFGDGRVMRTTLAGNSAHIVLDADGCPLDVLPGVYGPVAFRRELEAILPLARESGNLSAVERARRLREHHATRSRAVIELWADGADDVVFEPDPPAPILAAERLTFGKMLIETPALTGLGLLETVPGSVRMPTQSFAEARLDARSRALVRKLQPTDWAADPRPLEGEAFEALIASIESSVAQDTRRNELELHARIRSWFLARQPLDFAALNERLYRELFLTPADDPWLGLGTPGTFTGLPGDGIEREPR